MTGVKQSQLLVLRLSLEFDKNAISGSPLEKYGDGVYEDLFVTALRNHGMLSIGLYR